MGVKLGFSQLRKKKDKARMEEMRNIYIFDGKPELKRLLLRHGHRLEETSFNSI
jgi:hypothetical protein